MDHFMTADILLPKTGFEKWAVVACDQYTSQPDYWEETERIVGDAPSALRIILPELYLSDDNKERIDSVNTAMREYLDGGVFCEHKDAMIYVERESSGKVRKGIVGLIDLEDYDYSRDSSALIRATEATVLERIPPRVEIRKDAPLEMPHIMLLTDDINRSVIEPLSKRKGELEPAYSFELMQGGGHIEGYFLDKKGVEDVQNALKSLLDSREDKLLFAVGDGNHSLATAKECYRQSGNEKARYALAEIVNIHDESIEFEPIYRVLFNVDKDDFIKSFESYTEAEGKDETQRFEIISPSGEQTLELKATAKLPVGTLQTFIDAYMKEHPEVSVDYIHGADVTRDLCKNENTLGFIFEGMKKDELFDAIIADGSLPRKTFSMGHASDKRYYIEARKIK